MAERKAVNKYYPPEWTPEKGSINKFRGTHALRERARKLHMGILIIRFEMPYNIWCEGCNNHIGTGVRYNAEKTKVGMYYTTPVYKFRMKCHLCTNHFEIQTDPKNLDYVILSGARRQERRWDPTQNEQVAPDDKDVSKQLMTNSMYKLEHNIQDKEKHKQVAPTIANIEEYQERWKDDYSLNKLARQKFREKKKEQKAQIEHDKILLNKFSLNIPLLPENNEDIKLAGLLKLMPVDTFEERRQRKREEIESGPIFSKASSSDMHSKSKLSVTKSKFIQSYNEQKAQTLHKLLSNKLGIIRKNEKNLPGNGSEECSLSNTELNIKSDKVAHGSRIEASTSSSRLLVSADYEYSNSESENDEK